MRQGILLVVSLLIVLAAGATGADDTTLSVPPTVAQRGWIVVVRGPGGGMSGSTTNELPDKYTTRAVRITDGQEMRVQSNQKLTVTAPGSDPWAVIVSRWYQGVGFMFTHLFFLDTPTAEFSDLRAFELLLAYKSFGFGEQTYVIYCPPRAKVTWEGSYSPEPITDGECKADATLTIALDQRTPTVLHARLLKVERNTGRMLVQLGAD